jgi:hypothetical protein
MAMSNVSRDQRHTRAHPCPICGGCESDRRGQGVRCAGFTSEDGEWARCQQVVSPRVDEKSEPAIYVHRLHGDCDCGQVHGAPTVERPRAKSSGKDDLDWKNISEYIYRDVSREPVFRVVRNEAPNPKGSKPVKRFSQSRYIGEGRYDLGIEGVERVLYHLPELLESDPALPVFIPEGEKCVEALEALTCVSTTSSGGAGKWSHTPNAREALRGRNVIILPDHDGPNTEKPHEAYKGQRHAKEIANDLEGVAASVRVLELPGLPITGDVVDWLAAGGTKAQLDELAQSAPLAAEWTPPAKNHSEDQSAVPDDGISASDSKETSEKKTKHVPAMRDRLITLAEDLGTDFFHTPDQTAFARVPVGDHHETWALKSSGFRQLLSRAFYQRYQTAPNEQAYQEARGVLEGQAIFDGLTHKVWLRTARHEDAIYLDLCDDDWRAVKITSSGWEVVSNPPIRFRRAKGMLALPTPVTGGEVESLRSFMNVNNDSWPLVPGWLMGAYSPDGPYPDLLLRGPQGTAKTTIARMLRALTDPHELPVRKPPRDSRDLAIAAHNAWVVVYDNLSSIQQWLSDDLCRLSTGGGFGTRLLYTDDEEALFHAVRPVILTGIEDVVSESDLLDRTIMLPLSKISTFRPEKEIWRDFNAEAPGILGALLTMVSGALCCLLETETDTSLRMADFALWAAAAERGSGSEEKTFLIAYAEQRRDADSVAREASSIAAPLQAWWAKWSEQHPGQEWEGTSTELLAVLNKATSEELWQGKDWPKNPRALSGRLARLAPNLESAGIEAVRPSERGETGRKWIIRKVRGRDRQDRQDAHDEAPKPEPKGAGATDGRSEHPDGMRQTVGRLSADRQAVNPRKIRSSDGPDGPDGTAGTFSPDAHVPLSGEVTERTCSHCGYHKFWTLDDGIERCQMCSEPVPGASDIEEWGTVDVDPSAV